MFPLKDSDISSEVRTPPSYSNPSDDPSVRNVMVFCIFQEMRALESVQSKDTTPREDAKLAQQMLAGTYSTQPTGWVDY